MIAVNAEGDIGMGKLLIFSFLLFVSGMLFTNFHPDKIVYTKTKKFGYYHRYSCCSLYGKIYSMTEEDAKANKMERCERCMP